MRALVITMLFTLLAPSAFAQELKTDQDKTLYTVGQLLGRQLGAMSLTKAELAIIVQGLSDGATGATAQVDCDQWSAKALEFVKARLAAHTDTTTKASPDSAASGSAVVNKKAVTFEAVEKPMGNAEYAGVVGFVYEMTATEPFPWRLAQVAGKLPVVSLKSPGEFTQAVPIHTDIKVLRAMTAESDTNRAVDEQAAMDRRILTKSVGAVREPDPVSVLCTGTIAYVNLPYTDKTTDIGGYPGTRLDLSELDGTMTFIGKKWTPKAGEGAVILITKDRVEAFGCTVEDTTGAGN